MKLPARSSTRRRYHECGVPMNVEMKKQLRNRSMLLSSDQRNVLRKMGINIDKTITEKQAVKIAKRICGPETNYRVNPEGSKLFRKRIAAKPKSVTARQAKIEVLAHRIENGSKQAVKRLAIL